MARARSGPSPSTGRESPGPVPGAATHARRSAEGAREVAHNDDPGSDAASAHIAGLRTLEMDDVDPQLRALGSAGAYRPW